MEFAIFDEISTVQGEEQARTYDEHLQMVVSAERLGYHSYWFAEHHFGTDRAAPSPNLMIAAASQLTSKIMLGNMINVLPFHNPVRLAEETAMLDHLTDGRVQFGIGRGVRPPEFQRYMVDMNVSREMFTESFEMHRQLWTTPGASAHGNYWSYEDVTIVPPVLQKPYPPVWCTGMNSESVRWAAEQGLPYATSFLSTAETAALGEQYREAFRPSEHWSQPCFVVMRHMYISDSMSSARAEVWARLRPVVSRLARRRADEPHRGAGIVQGAPGAPRAPREHEARPTARRGPHPLRRHGRGLRGSRTAPGVGR